MAKHFKYFNGSAEEALAFVKKKLEENPNTPRSFFINNWDISEATLNRWVSEDKVKFVAQPKLRMRGFK